jgi:hypothetical protein
MLLKFNPVFVWVGKSMFLNFCLSVLIFKSWVFSYYSAHAFHILLYSRFKDVTRFNIKTILIELLKRVIFFTLVGVPVLFYRNFLATYYIIRNIIGAYRFMNTGYYFFTRS